MCSVSSAVPRAQGPKARAFALRSVQCALFVQQALAAALAASPPPPSPFRVTARSKGGLPMTDGGSGNRAGGRLLGRIAEARPPFVKRRCAQRYIASDLQLVVQVAGSFVSGSGPKSVFSPPPARAGRRLLAHRAYIFYFSECRG